MSIKNSSFGHPEDYYSGFAAMPKLPYGYLVCSCEKYPKIEYINNHMLKFLEIDRESSDWKNFLQENFYFIVPFDERDKIRSCFEKAIVSEEPIPIEHELIKGNGSRAYVSGWIYCSEFEDGSKKFILLYLPSIERRDSSRNNSYFNALKSAYGIIFEVNLSKKTVECIHGRETSLIGSVYDIRMTLDSAKKFWLNNCIVSQDREMMAEYFDWITTPGAILEEKRPLQAEFSIVWEGVTYKMLGVAVQLDSSIILFCARDISEVKFSYSNVHEQGVPSSGAYARTFGHFDLFVNGSPVIFSSAKEKELLALLIDRNGGSVSSEEAISFLWENEYADVKLKAKYRKLAMTLKNTLAKHGVEDMIVNVNGTRSINKAALRCDYYELLSGNEQARAAFHNNYMSGYSWAENTLASLWDYS